MEEARTCTNADAARTIVQQSVREEKAETQEVAEEKREEKQEKAKAPELAKEPQPPPQQKQANEGEEKKEAESTKDADGETKEEEKPAKKVVQSIWDTSSNDAAVERLAQTDDGTQAALQFMPFKVRQRVLHVRLLTSRAACAWVLSAYLRVSALLTCMAGGGGAARLWRCACVWG